LGINLVEFIRKLLENKKNRYSDLSVSINCFINYA
jgi:hypothetical protein